MPFQDKTIVCKDCGAEFIFTAGEQEFFFQKGYTNDPVRCPSCRAARRGASGTSSRRPMFDVVCSSCGRPTQVPFEPRGDRPVYCRDCFERERMR